MRLINPRTLGLEPMVEIQGEIIGKSRPMIFFGDVHYTIKRLNSVDRIVLIADPKVLDLRDGKTVTLRIE